MSRAWRLSATRGSPSAPMKIASNSRSSCVAVRPAASRRSSDSGRRSTAAARDRSGVRTRRRRAFSTLTASAVTSFPIPSPAMTAILTSATGLYCRLSTADCLDRHRHSHAAADAQRREPRRRPAALHFVQQRDDDARAGAADRMAERDRAAVDVQLLRGDRHVLQHREHLRGERFVELDEIEIVEPRPVRSLQLRDRRAPGRCP